MTKPPLISVVVPTYQRREAVLRVLERLSAQTLPADQFEVLVVIDGSTDGTREAVGSLATPFAQRSIWQENRGRSAARNTGLRAARGDFVAILDDDVEPVPGFLSAHLRAHADGRRLGVVGAVHFRLDDATPPFTRFEGLRFEDFIARLVKRGSLLDWSETYIGAFSARRTAFLEVGGFEELFDGYGLEDFEIALRLSRAGLLFELSTEAVAHHRHEKVFRRAAREHESRGRSAVILAKLHPPITAQDFGTRDLSPPSPPRRLVRYALPRMSASCPYRHSSWPRWAWRSASTSNGSTSPMCSRSSTLPPRRPGGLARRQAHRQRAPLVSGLSAVARVGPMVVEPRFPRARRGMLV
jgi:glycosyltransferase involved in cell wall biosynthesis